MGLLQHTPTILLVYVQGEERGRASGEIGKIWHMPVLQKSTLPSPSPARLSHHAPLLPTYWHWWRHLAPLLWGGGRHCQFVAEAYKCATAAQLYDWSQNVLVERRKPTSQRATCCFLQRTASSYMFQKVCKGTEGIINFTLNPSPGSVLECTQGHSGELAGVEEGSGSDWLKFPDVTKGQGRKKVPASEKPEWEISG